MKKYIIIIALFSMSTLLYAQKKPRERIRTFKIAYITEQLNLTSTEAQQFWPIYNAHEEKKRALKKQERKKMIALQESTTIDQLNEKQTSDFIDSYLALEIQKTDAKSKMITALKTVISNQKIIRLLKAEAEFKRKLMQKLRERNKQR